MTERERKLVQLFGRKGKVLRNVNLPKENGDYHMGKIFIRKISITDIKADAIVNAANEKLQEGGGVCGAIFKMAGSKELTHVCSEIGGCKTGSAVITPGFKLSAKFIIHAVGPIWQDGEHGEPSLLYDVYKSSLELAKENDCHSIAFPLISAGIYGYPKRDAWHRAIRACFNFISNNPDYDIDITFAILDDSIIALGKEVLKKIEDEAKGIKENRALYNIGPLTKELDRKVEEFCKKYINLLKVLTTDKELKEWCKTYSIYKEPEEHKSLKEILYRDFMQHAYNEGIVVSNYGEIIDQSGLNKKNVSQPDEIWVKDLTKQQIIACIAYHFRMDHFDNGSLINHSIAEGYLYNLMLEYLGKCTSRTDSNAFLDNEVNITPKIIGFYHEYDDYGCFSNWYHAEFDYGRTHFLNTEQYMMFQKVLMFKKYDLADQILKSDNPEECKKIAGQKFPEFKSDIWEKTCKTIVKRGVKAKFVQNKDILDILLSTGNAILAECSSKDNKWGIGIDLSDSSKDVVADWKGSNLLGRILMEVRDEFREEMICLSGHISEFRNAHNMEPIPEWNMTAGELKRMPQYYDAIHAYSDTLNGYNEKKAFYDDFSLYQWEIAMATNMGGGLPVAGFYELKQDIYDTAYRLRILAKAKIVNYGN